MAFLKMKWNLNYEIGFVMNHDARLVWDDYHAELFGRCETIPDPPKPESDGMTWMQMHEFMEIYGSEKRASYFPVNTNVVLLVKPEDCFDALRGGQVK